MKVCIAPFRVLWDPGLGGYAWIYLNWALGLQANGCEVVWVEAFRRDQAPAEALQSLGSLLHQFDAVGLRASVALILSEEEKVRFRPVEQELARLSVPLEAVAEEAELLLNFRYSQGPEFLSRFKRTALVDIDPGLLQIWMSEGQIQVSEYDVCFTIGETVGRPGSLIPDCGRSWVYTPPPVFLPAWPTVPADSRRPYTTVTSWWAPAGGGNWQVFRGEAFNNEKRTSFLEYADLPSRVPVRCELAIEISSDEEDWKSLEQKGWSLQRASQACSTPQTYRSYIQRSRGEFSCAKASCMRLQNAWISDRTLCYLASGKPAVVQHTGASRFLPEGEGLFRFRNLEEAAAGLSAAEADYQRHARLARDLVAEYFDAEQVVAAVLERASG